MINNNLEQGLAFFKACIDYDQKIQTQQLYT